jgi:pilus assembly protein CpaB
VDLLLTMTLQPGGGQGGVSRHVSETLLRNVRIVGMDQSFTDGKKDDKVELSVPKTATLEVTPKQAEIIAVSTDLGVLSLALRSVASDDAPDGAAPITKTWDTEATQIAFAPHAAPSASAHAPNAGPARFSVEVVRGAGEKVS